MTLRKKFYENILKKGENTGELHRIAFLTPMYCVTCKCFELEWSQILSFGKT